MRDKNNDVLDYKIVRESKKSAMLSFSLGKEEEKSTADYVSIEIDFNAKDYTHWSSSLERNLAQKYYKVDDLVVDTDEDSGLKTVQIVKDEHRSAYFFFQNTINLKALDFSLLVASCSFKSSDAICSTKIEHQSYGVTFEYQKRHLKNSEKITTEVNHILSDYFSLRE